MRTREEIAEMTKRCFARENREDLDYRGEHDLETIVKDDNGEVWALLTTYDYDYDLEETIGTCWEGYQNEILYEKCNEEIEVKEAVLYDPDNVAHDVRDIIEDLLDEE